MDSLTDYVTTWFHTREFFPYFSGGTRANAAWLADEERSRPGFVERLQNIALEYLNSGTPEETAKALRILAVTASKNDLPKLKDLLDKAQEPLRTQAKWAYRRIRWRHSPLPLLLIGISVGIIITSIILGMLSQ